MSDDVELTSSFPDPTQLSVTCGESLGMRLELTHPHANCLVFDLSKHVILSAWNIRLCSLSSLVPPAPTLLLPRRRVGTRLRTVISHLYDLTFLYHLFTVKIHWIVHDLLFRAQSHHWLLCWLCTRCTAPTLSAWHYQREGRYKMHCNWLVGG